MRRRQSLPLASLRAACAALLLALSAAGAASAGDGRIEIDQAGALRGGLTAGDAPGFPVTISESGSYLLTGNLVVPDLLTTAISIAASGVDIDLGGFVISGPNFCSQDATTLAVTCASTLGGVGIELAMFTLRGRVSIRNGAIVGMGGSGVKMLGEVKARLESLVVHQNGGGAFVNAFAHEMARSRVWLNGGSGVGTGDMRVRDVVSAQNSGTGFLGPGVARGAIAYRNGGGGGGAATGPGVDLGRMVDASLSAQNFEEGFASTARISRSLAVQNRGDGITLATGAVATNGAVAAGNAVWDNDGAGIVDGSAAQNLVAGNGGAEISGVVETGENVCNTNTTCP